MQILNIPAPPTMVKVRLRVFHLNFKQSNEARRANDVAQW